MSLCWINKQARAYLKEMKTPILIPLRFIPKDQFSYQRIHVCDQHPYHTPAEADARAMARIVSMMKMKAKLNWDHLFIIFIVIILALLLLLPKSHAQISHVDIEKVNNTQVDANGIPVKVLSCAGCGGGASGDTTVSGVIGSLNATLQIAMTGQNSAAITLPAGNNLIGALLAESSSDNGVTWSATVIRSSASTGLWASSQSVSSTNASFNIQVPGGASHVRVRVNPYTSGTATAGMRATTQPDSQPDPLVQGTQAPASTTAPNPLVQGGWDGSAVRAFKTDSTGILQMNISGLAFSNITGSISAAQCPDADAATEGCVTAGTQTFGGAKTFQAPTFDVTSAANANTTLSLNSGINAINQSALSFNDQGASKYLIKKDSANNFGITDQTVGDRYILTQTGSNFHRTGAPSGQTHFFQNSDGTPGLVQMGTLQVGNVAGIRIVDGTKFALTAAGIQAAHDDLPAGGGQIIVPVGFNLTAGTVFTKPTCLFGSGQAMTTFNYTPATGVAFTWSGTGGCYDHFTLTTSTSTTSQGIQITNASEVFGNNVNIHGFNGNWRVTGNGSTTYSSGIRLTNFLIDGFTGAGSYGMSLDHVNDVFFGHGRIYTVTDSLTATGAIIDQGVGGLWLDNSTFEQGLNAVRVQKSALGGNYGVSPAALFFNHIVADNTTGGDAILFDSTLGTDNVRTEFVNSWASLGGRNIAGTCITNTATGIRLNGGSNIKWTGGQIRGNCYHGYFLNVAGDVYGIHGSVINSNNLSATSDGNGVTLNGTATSVRIIGNRIGNITAFDASGGQKFGIGGTGNVAYIIKGNDLSGNVTGRVQNVATFLEDALVTSAGAAPTASGSMAYDTTANNFRGGVNGVKDTFAMLELAQNFTAGQTFQLNADKTGQASIVADSAAINTTEAIIIKTPALAASRLIAGSHIRITLTGTCTSTVANTSTFTLRWGTNGTTADATVAALVSSVAAVSGTNNGFRSVIDLTIRTIGASATSDAFMELLSDGNIGIVATPNEKFVAGTTFNSTTANGILSVAYKSAATTTTSTFKNAIIEVVYQ